MLSCSSPCGTSHDRKLWRRKKGLFERLPISTGKAYGLARVCHVWGLPRSTVYWQRQQPKGGAGRRRGPQGFHSDAALAGQIKAEIASRPFPGEGYRKIWAGLRGKGIRTSPTRTLRLMRENVTVKTTPSYAA